MMGGAPPGEFDGTSCRTFGALLPPAPVPIKENRYFFVKLDDAHHLRRATIRLFTKYRKLDTEARAIYTPCVSREKTTVKSVQALYKFAFPKKLIQYPYTTGQCYLTGDVPKFTFRVVTQIWTLTQPSGLRRSDTPNF
jgi:hypothetical protein